MDLTRCTCGITRSLSRPIRGFFHGSYGVSHSWFTIEIKRKAKERSPLKWFSVRSNFLWKISFVREREGSFFFIYFFSLCLDLSVEVFFSRYTNRISHTLAISIGYIGFQIYLNSTSIVRAIKCTLLRDFVSRWRSQRAQYYVSWIFPLHIW